METTPVDAANRNLLLRFIRFGLVGGSGVIVNLGIYAFLTRVLGLATPLLYRNLSYAVSVEVSVLTNFLLNDIWTFRDRRGSAKFSYRLWRFHVVSLVGFALNWGVFAGLNWLLHRSGAVLIGELNLGPLRLGNVDDLLAACLGIGVAMFWNFFGNLIWTWGRKPALPE